MRTIKEGIVLKHDATPTTAEEFKVATGGQYKVVIGKGGSNTFPASVKLQIRFTQSNGEDTDWITDEEFTEPGTTVMIMDPQTTFRFLPSAAGAEAWMTLLPY